MGPTSHLFHKSSPFLPAACSMVGLSLRVVPVVLVNTGPSAGCGKENGLISKRWRGMDRCVYERVRSCVDGAREEGRKSVYKSHLANPSVASLFPSSDLCTGIVGSVSLLLAVSLDLAGRSIKTFSDLHALG